MHIQTLTKFRVAEVQLLKAIDLFCSGEPIPAITLAGAAEEILGRLVQSGGGTSALDEEVKDSLDLHRTFFGRDGNRKAMADDLNAARNQLKHNFGGIAAMFDLEQEAVSLIERAITNFRKIQPGLNASFQKFDDAAVAWDRRRSGPIT